MGSVSELVEIPELIEVLNTDRVVSWAGPAVVSQNHGEVIAGPVHERLELVRRVVVLHVEVLDELVNVTTGRGLDEVLEGDWVVVAGTPVRVNVIVEEPEVPSN